MNDETDLEQWLPTGLPPAAHPVWEARVSRTLVATESAMVRLEHGFLTGEGSWWWEMGRWWQPAAVLAAAAIALLITVSDREVPGSGDDPAHGVALTLIASEGDPVALWEALGIPADPVLALLTLEAHSAPLARGERP